MSPTMSNSPFVATREVPVRPGISGRRRRALLVCAPSPRIAGSAPVGTTKLVRAMLDAGWDVDILACRFEKRSVDDPFFSRLLEGAWLYEGNSLFEKPSTWVPRAVFTGNRLLADRSYDVLLSLAHLTWTHVVALCLRRERRPPWIAYFTDPWSNHPLRRMSFVRRMVERELERRTLAQADALVFTHPSMRDYILAPRRSKDALYSKSFAIPYFFDADMYPPMPLTEPNGKLVMRHMGNIPPGGYVRGFLDGLRMLLNERRELAGRMAVEFYGGHTPAHRALVRQFDLQGQVSFHSAVSYQDSLRLMRESDLLLFLGTPPAECRGLGNATLYLKMADYIGARRPIFALAGLGSPTHHALCSTNGVCCKEDPAAITAALAAFIDDPQLPTPAVLSECSKDRVFPLWEALFDRVMGASMREPSRSSSPARECF